MVCLHYSALKRMKYKTCYNMGEPQNLLTKRIQMEKLHIVWVHLYEISKKGNIWRQKVDEWLPRTRDGKEN